MTIDTAFFKRCIQTLEIAHTRVRQCEEDSIEYDMYRSACVKEFEIILEQAGKLLRKCLVDFVHSPKAISRLVFKEVFRMGAQHDLISLEEAERWLIYRDNRNNTAHDYGKKFAEQTLQLIPEFIGDAKRMEESVREHAKRVADD
ncbi:nucleotidyltransferase substrate binding protein [Sansalvadorimonas sp. 2012CJ34-2]|uniref:Nucleotidyltransferase substrate binding protein n=1 Tax=Parendozoicomonas callyspongiae TaxID=2942213 RepID=A0ABT0PHC2_9GAMM|nr:nucleotidyltransferase substrate binding protein [Sansalvadorimonas sp. 2012CJ34-2]MCL6270777.1 nucleotidyltransferase substrate binding protein [Sansalvadorimonas sp. 2012CJ34-2]